MRRGRTIPGSIASLQSKPPIRPGLASRLRPVWPLLLALSLACSRLTPSQPGSSAQAPVLPRPTETPDERRARLLASQPDLKSFLTEGLVITARCDDQPPALLIGAPTDPITVRLESPGFDCWRVRPGDYLFVISATRRSDHLYEASRLILDPQ
jgi:hypothetical protein